MRRSSPPAEHHPPPRTPSPQPFAVTFSPTLIHTLPLPLSLSLSLSLLLTFPTTTAAVAGVSPSISPITALAFHPAGDTFVSNGPRTVQVRNPSDNRVLQVWPCPIPHIRALVFSPSGDRLAVAGGSPGEQGEVHLLNWPDGRLLTRLTLPNDVATSVAFHPNGQSLAVAGFDGSARIWSLPESFPGPDQPPQDPSTPPRHELKGHAGAILAVAWSPTGDPLLTASTDRSIKVWTTANPNPNPNPDNQPLLLRTLGNHTESPNALAFRPAPPGSILPATPPICASAADDRTVRIWQPSIGRMIRIVRNHPGPVLALAWMPDGSSLLSGGTDGVIRRIDADSDAILATSADHSDWILALAVSPDGRHLASGDASGRVIIRPPPAPASP